MHYYRHTCLFVVRPFALDCIDTYAVRHPHKSIYVAKQFIPVSSPPAGSWLDRDLCTALQISLWLTNQTLTPVNAYTKAYGSRILLQTHTHENSLDSVHIRTGHFTETLIVAFSYRHIHRNPALDTNLSSHMLIHPPHGASSCPLPRLFV